MPRISSKAMALKPAIAVLDACVLYPFHLRNVLVQMAADRLVEARWTEQIHDEWIRNLTANVPTIPVERLQVTRQLMNNALSAAMVSDYQDHIPMVHLTDPDDRHVVAAGIAAGAGLVITWNLRDFPAPELKRHGLRKLSPDAFLSDLYDQAPDLVVGSLANARRNLSKTRVSAPDFVLILNNQKLTKLVARIRKRLTDL